MKRTALLLLLALLFAALAATCPLRAADAASPAPTLVELYSSEGCSSCPPAEAWVSGLKDDPALWKTLFPVVFHVDYWDDLGWPDRFARPEFTQRQYDLAWRLRQDSVYTPEFVVDGAEWRPGLFRRGKPAGSGPKAGVLTVALGEGGAVSAGYVPQAGAAPRGPLTLCVALLGFGLVTDVKRGENGGRRLAHDFVAVGFASAPLAAEGGGFRAAPFAVAPTTGDKPGAYVAWVEDGSGAVLQVVGGPLPPS